MSPTDLPSRTSRVPWPGRGAWGQLIRAEVRMVVRDTAGLVVPIGLPILILVMYGIATSDEPIPAFGGLTAFDAVVVPLALVIVIATIGVVNMPSFLATYRKTGVLRRLAVTPLHPAMVLVAQVITSAVQAMVGIGLALVVGRLAFGLATPRHVWATIGILVVAAAAMYAVGMLVAALAPTANAAVAIGLITFFGMGAVGGLFGSPDDLPDPLAGIGEVTPFGAAFQALQASWIGQPLEVVHVAALIVTAVGASVLAAVWFRWE